MNKKMAGMHRMPSGKMMPDAEMMEEKGEGKKGGGGEKHDMDDKGHPGKMKKAMTDHGKVKVPWSGLCK